MKRHSATNNYRVLTVSLFTFGVSLQLLFEWEGRGGEWSGEQSWNTYTQKILAVLMFKTLHSKSANFLSFTTSYIQSAPLF
jgi:hypothetical protein